MINSKPNDAGNYRQGLYIPQNKEKVYKLNEKGGLYYRSSWELTAMKYFDMKEEVIAWGAESIEIPYQLKKPDRHGIIALTNHRYYPDFYYKLRMDDGSTREILLEVKPREQTIPPKFKQTANLTKKQLENYQYSINEYNRNMCKWEAAISYCEPRGIEFKILVEEQVKRMLKSIV